MKRVDLKKVSIKLGLPIEGIRGAFLDFLNSSESLYLIPFNEGLKEKDFTKISKTAHNLKSNTYFFNLKFLYRKCKWLNTCRLSKKRFKKVSYVIHQIESELRKIKMEFGECEE